MLSEQQQQQDPKTDPEQAAAIEARNGGRKQPDSREPSLDEPAAMGKDYKIVKISKSVFLMCNKITV